MSARSCKDSCELIGRFKIWVPYWTELGGASAACARILHYSCIRRTATVLMVDRDVNRCININKVAAIIMND